MVYDISEVDIKPGIKSDHSLITLDLNLHEIQQRGMGFWKFNSSLLKDEEYTNKIKTCLDECKEKYSNFENKTLLLDVIKCEIRSQTISFSTWKAKQRREYGQQLEKRLHELEKQIGKGENVLHEHLTVKSELEEFLEENAKGALIRSRVKYTE